MKAQSENSEKLEDDALQKIAACEKSVADSEKALLETEDLIRLAEEKLAKGQGVREELRLRRGELSERLSQLKMQGIELSGNIKNQNLKPDVSRRDLMNLNAETRVLKMK